MDNFSKYLEYSQLNPQCTAVDIDRLVSKARHFQFHGICVPPFWVKKAGRELASDSISLATVVGYPFGYQMTETKLLEIELALRDGADQIAVTFNATAFHSGMTWAKIELAKCAQRIHDAQKLFGVTLNDALFTDLQIRNAVAICRDAGADFITLLELPGTNLVSPGRVAMICELLSGAIELKVHAFESNPAHCMEIIRAGAGRFCSSNAEEIIREVPMT